MSRISLIALMFAASLWADESADRAAIGRSIAALNEVPRRTDLFTADANSTSLLDQLWKGKRLTFRARMGLDGAESSATVNRPNVTISHEPWGEATINIPPMPVEVLNPKIVSYVIRFITPDVALVDGASVYWNTDTGAESTPLLLVMKREGERWMITALRVVVRAVARP